MNQLGIKVLAVDDNDELLYALESILSEAGFQVITATNGDDALKIAANESPEIILLDVQMPGKDGLEVTRILKADESLRYIPIILVTAKDGLDDIVRGLDEGADGYIKKPFQKEELLARVRAMMRTRSLYLELQNSEKTASDLRAKVVERYKFSNIIGKSDALQRIFDLIGKIKDSSASVLVTGESGTGKELIAHAIHYNSPRKSGPFIIQNCSAFNENLLESELFGHVKGSFTGAAKDKQGLFQAADGGTFFMDELGEMSMPLQVKLLRVLQDGTFIPVGDTKSKKVDVRIIGATHRDLGTLVKQGAFREDLYYRLNVVNIRIPPLRERTVDIPLLIEHFLGEYAKKNRTPIKKLAPATLKLLVDFSWPGNVRQLQNEIERLALMSGSDTSIGPEFVSPEVTSGNGSANSMSAERSGKLKEALENLERNLIVAALERTGGNKSEAARELGISRSNLISKVQSYGLEES